MRPGDELIVVRGIAQTREALLAAHRPTPAGTSCRQCGYVYGEVRVCPAAAEALEGCSSLVASAPGEASEIVHVVCGPRPRRSGLRSWLLLVVALAAAAGLAASLVVALPAGVRLAVSVAVPVCVWRLAAAVLREARREREARGRDVLEPLV